MQRLLQRVEHKASVGRPGHPPANDPTRVCVNDKGHVDETRPGRHVGEIADPQGVRARCPELAVHAVERAGCGRVSDRGAGLLAPHRPLQAHRPHQPRNRAAGGHDPLAGELPPKLAHAVDAEVRLEHAPDLDHQGRVAPDPCRPLAGVGTPHGTGVIGRRGDRQHPADRLDPVGGAVIVNEGDHRLNGRSSSAWAKYADALRRISLAWRSSRTSRSRALICSRSSVVSPGR